MKLAFKYELCIFIKKNMILFEYKYRYQRFLTHLLFWISYVVLFAFLISVNTDLNFVIVLLRTFYYLPLDILATYLTIYVLIPRFLIKRKYLYFVLFFILIAFFNVLAYQVITYYIYIPLYFPQIPLEKFSFFDFDIWTSLVSNISIVIFAAAIKLTKFWIFEQQAKAELETEKAKSELMLLKSQINPHFIFNTLNNIDSLIITNPQKASESIIKLSEIMRYVTYEINADYVSVEQEINYLISYIELNRLRFGNDFIEFNTNIEINSKLIAPLLFIPLVENAIKHGYKNCPNPGIIINLEVGEKIYFSVKNYVSPDYNNMPKKPGIGISNLIKRLQYLYPKSYDLTFDHSNNQYVAILCLN